MNMFNSFVLRTPCPACFIYVSHSPTTWSKWADQSLTLLNRLCWSWEPLFVCCKHAWSHLEIPACSKRLFVARSQGAIGWQRVRVRVMLHENQALWCANQWHDCRFSGSLDPNAPAVWMDLPGFVLYFCPSPFLLFLLQILCPDSLQFRLCCTKNCLMTMKHSK